MSYWKKFFHSCCELLKQTPLEALVEQNTNKLPTDERVELCKGALH